MKNFEKIKENCEQQSAISENLVDDFLLYYADEQDHLSKKFDQRLAGYRHITKKFKEEWVNMLRAQFMAHRIFKKGGCINKYKANNHCSLLIDHCSLFTAN